jgi:superfamily I DNA/RNA helicase/RecB family exonuclease
VLAAPGSGKTTVVTQRFARLIREGVEPDQVLVLTFTRRAAEEMLARVEQEVGSLPVANPPLTTYDAFAGRIARRFGWLNGHSPSLRIATDAEQWMELSAAMADVHHRAIYNAAEPNGMVGQVRGVIVKAKQESVSPAAYEEWARRMLSQADPADEPVFEQHEAVALVYARLQERYAAKGIADHSDMVAVAMELLERQDSVREQFRDLKYLMVDEFQDTNRGQAQLISLLLGGRKNLLVVADDDQAIYKFRGASRANIKWFREKYPGHVEYRLLHNRRSTPEIINLAHAVIAPAEDREVKEMLPVRPPGEQPVLFQADTYRAEAAAVAARCHDLVAAGSPPSDIAVLHRNREDMGPIIDALRALDIPYVVSGGRDFFRQPEIKGLMALLQAVNDLDDSQAVLKCTNFPGWKLSVRSRVELSRAIDSTGTSLHELLLDGQLAGLEENDLTVARTMAAELERLSVLAQTEDVREVVFAALESSRYLGITTLDRSIEQRQMAANINRFAELLEEFAAISNELSLKNFLDYLTLVREAGAEGIAPIADEVEGVQLLTMHGAKGLEWRHVILVALSDWKLPGRDRGSWLSLPEELVPETVQPGDAHLEEERRVFYVALTRAKDTLMLTHAWRYPKSFANEPVTSFLADLPQATLGRRVLPLSPTPVPRARRMADVMRQGVDVSYSGLSDYQTCPRRYEYRHVWHLPEAPSTATWFGQLIHQALRTAMDIRKGGKPVDRNRLVAIWHETWASSAGPKGRDANLADEGRRMLLEYAETAAWRDADPAENEFSFHVQLSSGAQLKGRLDRVDRPGAPRVIDYKTGVPPRELDRLQSDLQAQTYAAAVAGLFHVDEVSVEMHYLANGRVARAVFGKEHLARAHSRLYAITKELMEATADRNFPAKPSNWNCTHCPYWVICDEGRTARADPAKTSA